MCPHQMCPHRSRRAFTLIELLVVIAIIALLVSILVPSLMTARKLTYKMMCATNLKNQGTALNMYIADNTDWFPPYYQDMLTAAGTHYAWYWQEQLVKYCDPSAIPTDGRCGSVANYAYVANQNWWPDAAKWYKNWGAVYSRAFYCAAQNGSGRMLHYGVLRNYSLDYRLTPAGYKNECGFPDPFRYDKIGDVRNPSRFVYAFETSSPNCYSWMTTDALIGRMANGTIHIGNCSNFMYAAGTVGSMTAAEIINCTPISKGFPFRPQ